MPVVNAKAPAMVKVRLLTGRVGLNRSGNSFAQAYGDIVELERDEAQRYIQGGMAELAKPETAHA